MIAVAIDGPAGAGKSSVARRVAAELGFLYVDTGALYRSIALHMLRCGVDLSDAAAVTAELHNIQLSLVLERGEQRVVLSGEDVSDLIRSQEVSQAASRVAEMAQVRDFLLQLQRDTARKQNVLMDGRDIGTVVLPDAQVKIFLTATAQERALRRFKQLQERGEIASFEAILREIQERDLRDENREIAPLRPAEDAVILDTTGMDLKDVLSKLKKMIMKKLEEIHDWFMECSCCINR